MKLNSDGEKAEAEAYVKSQMEKFKYKHGLAVMRCQPFHMGHARLIDHMLSECYSVTIVLGSIDKRDKRNPFPYHDRKKMIKNFYSQFPHNWSRMRIIGIPDISNDLTWTDYVLRSVKEHYVDNIEVEEYTAPDAYYAGSEYDGRWYRDSHMKVIIVDRINQTHPPCSGTMIRDLCEYNDPRWREKIHKVNHDLVQRWVGRIEFLSHEVEGREAL